MSARQRVSLPQSETIWTNYDTPADLLWLVLGLGACACQSVPALSGGARRRERQQNPSFAAEACTVLLAVEAAPSLMWFAPIQRIERK